MLLGIFMSSFEEVIKAWNDVYSLQQFVRQGIKRTKTIITKKENLRFTINLMIPKKYKQYTNIFLQVFFIIVTITIFLFDIHCYLGLL
mgnify:CR=1 FL=1